MRLCRCGKEVRIQAERIRVHVSGTRGRQGVRHWLEHADGTRVCIRGEWHTVALKPYAKDESRRPWRLMLAQWDAACPMAVGRIAGGE